METAKGLASQVLSSGPSQKELPTQMKNPIKLTVIAAVTCAVSAYAVPTLTIEDGNPMHTVTITDGSSGDSCPNVGCVTWIGTIGVWNINVDTGLTKPATGDATHLDMDLSLVGHSTAAGTLTLTWSDDGYTVNGTGVDGIGGTTDGSVFDNILINHGVVMSQGPFGSGAFSGTTTGNIL
jgi:hypothetical protein